jgi:hypothetical protein
MNLLKGDDKLASVNRNPKAEPKINPRRASHPIASLEVLGRLYQGIWMAGSQMAAIGLVKTELGMNRQAIRLSLGEGGESIIIINRWMGTPQNGHTHRIKNQANTV